MGNARVLRQLPRSLKRTAPRGAVDPAAMERAVEAFLRAAGLPLSDPNLQQTPQRVAQAWAEEFLDGYRLTAEEALGETYPAPRASEDELVVVEGLRFHSMCPHHLLPFEGTAHVAYIPGRKVVGFGRLAALVDCFAHRLILQEELAREVASALSRVLGSPGTACILEARHLCLRARGSRQADAVAHAEAYEGVLRKDRQRRAELWARLSHRSR